jgi:hypothetical protein
VDIEVDFIRFQPAWKPQWSADNQICDSSSGPRPTKKTKWLSLCFPVDLPCCFQQSVELFCILYSFFHVAEVWTVNYSYTLIKKQ